MGVPPLWVALGNTTIEEKRSCGYLSEKLSELLFNGGLY